MLSQGGDRQSTGALNGVKAALDEINSNDDLLPGYSLHYTLTNSKCNRAGALDGLFTQLSDLRQPKIALIVSGCPTTTDATAEISDHYNNITHISCTSSLSDDANYRVNYFQLLPSDVRLYGVLQRIITEYNWRRVVLIVQTHCPRFKFNPFLLANLSESMVNYSQLLVDEEKLKSGQFKFDTRSRIYVLATSSKLARQLMCQAYQLGMKYPKYVFITYAIKGTRWWITQDNIDHGCTSENIAEVLEFSLAISNFPFPSKNKLYYDICYDATLALAHSVHAVTQKVDLYDNITACMWNEKCNYDRISACNHEFQRCGSIMHSLLNNYLHNVSFTGTSGPVHFDRNGFRKEDDLRVLQYRTTFINGTQFPIYGSLSDRLMLVTVAHYVGDKDNESLEFVGGNNSIMWPSYVPYDGVPRTKLVTISPKVTIVFSILNTAGILYALLCLFFNIIFHKKRLVRLDSPNLNYLIIVGSFMAYSSCIVFVIPTLNPSTMAAFCVIRTSLAPVGYSLTYGSVIVKLWRIYSIFRNPKVKKSKMGIKDHHLLLIMLFLTLVDVIILTVYIVVEAALTHFNADTMPNDEKLRSVDGELDVETLYVTLACSTNPWIRQISIGFLYLYKFIQYVCALYYAFRLSKVNLIKGLDDAKYIVAFVYITSIVIALTFIITLTLNKYINVYASVYSFGFWFVTSSILGLLFVPKMIRFYKDSTGTNTPSLHEDSGRSIHQLKRIDSSAEAVKHK